MTIQLGIATFVGAAMFPFIIRMIWGRFVEKFGEIGGFLSALFIVGVMWAITMVTDLFTKQVHGLTWGLQQVLVY